MSRFARTAGENDRILIRHPFDRHTQRVNRPTLLKKRPAADDLRHNPLAGLVNSPPVGSCEWCETFEKRSVTPYTEHRGTKNRNSGHGGQRSPILLRRWSDTPLLNRATGLTHPRPRFQKGNLPTGKTAVMDELITDCAPRPSSPEHRFIPIEVFLAHSAQPRLNRKQHRLPLPAAFSNTHSEGSIAGRTNETQGDVSMKQLLLFVPSIRTTSHRSNPAQRWKRS